VDENPQAELPADAAYRRAKRVGHAMLVPRAFWHRRRAELVIGEAIEEGLAVSSRCLPEGGFGAGGARWR
jgi:hypothetical protein